MAPAAWAAQYVGIPFAPHGRTHRAVDCYGVVALALAEVFNVEVPFYGYASGEDWGGIEAAVARGLADWRPVPREEAAVGDGLVLRLRGRPLHVGLVVDTQPLSMLHSLAGTDTCIARLDGPVWGPRLLGVYRWMPR
jgi:cell wall-associated NlpC family hydrolase